MSEIKRYEVAIDYKARDNASPALNGIERAAQRSAKSTGALTKSLIGFGAAIAGSRALGAAKSAFVSFNAGLEDSRVIMAGMLQMNVGGSMEANMARATKSVERFQQMAKASALTTKDLVGMAQMIEGPLLQAGAGMRQIENLTFGAANAAKAFQIPAEMAALDIQQAINGTLSSKDRFAKSILSQKGINMSSEKFNKLSSGDRLGVLSKALNSDAIKQMAQAQSETFSGVVSTLQDNLEMAAGRVGLPLFKAISKEIKGWNDWLERNQNKVERFAKSFADGLVTAFGYLRDGVGFIIRHADTLLMIGKVWAAAKIGGAVAGGIGGLGRMAQGVAGGSYGATSVLSGALASYTLFSHAFKELGLTAQIHRKIMDRTTLALESVQQSLSGMDKAMQDAQDEFRGQKGAKGTVAYANAIGMSRYDGAKLEVLRDIEAKRYEGAGSLVWRAAQNARLQAGGFNDDEREKLLGNSAARRKLIAEMEAKSNVKVRADSAAAITDKRIEEVLSVMSQDQKDAVDIAAKTQTIMAAMNSAMALGQGPLTFEQVKQMLMPTADEMGTRQDKKDTTNVHIAKVEVAAKDPDRWIADLDAKVNKQIKAPKAAKRALRGAL